MENLKALEEKILSVLEEMDIDISMVNYESEEGKECIIIDGWKEMEELEKKLNMDMEKICKVLNCEYIFYDEVYYCEYCGCYHWIEAVDYKTNYSTVGHYILCHKELRENLEDYLEYFINNMDMALPFKAHKEMQELGYTLINNIYESGLTGVDNLKKVFEKYRKKYNNIVFFIDSATPFDTSFSVYVKNNDDVE